MLNTRFLFKTVIALASMSSALSWANEQTSKPGICSIQDVQAIVKAHIAGNETQLRRVKESVFFKNATPEATEKYLHQHYKTFNKINIENNTRFRKAAHESGRYEPTAPQTPHHENANQLFMQVSLLPLKEINDIDKSLATTLGNTYKSFFYEEIANNPALSSKIKDIPAYEDFKNIAFLFDSNTPELKDALLKAYEETNKRFAQATEKLKPKYKPLGGLAADPQSWHAAGIGKSNAQANIALRTGRKKFKPGQPLPLVEFDQISQELIQGLKKIDDTMKFLEINLGKHSPLLDQSLNKTPIPSLEAIETFRAIKPQVKSAEGFRDEMIRLFKKRFKMTLTPQQADDLKSVITSMNEFSVDRLQRKRVQLDWETTFGSADFAGQGARNIYETFVYVSGTQNPNQAALLAAQAEEKATRYLGKRKAFLNKTAKDYMSQYLPRLQQKGLEIKIDFSGDDGIIQIVHSWPQAAGSPRRPQGVILTQKRKKDFFIKMVDGLEAERGNITRMSSSGDILNQRINPGYPKDYRMVLNLEDLFEENKNAIGARQRTLQNVKAELLEKSIRQELWGEVSDSEMNKILIATDLKPVTDQQSDVYLYIISEKSIPAQRAAEIQKKILDAYKKIQNNNPDFNGLVLKETLTR